MPCAALIELVLFRRMSYHITGAVLVDRTHQQRCILDDEISFLKATV